MNYQEIHKICHQVGMEAGINARPVPVRVGYAKSPFSDEIDYSKPTHILDDGPCGFAWIIIQPGNSKLAREYKRMGIASKAYEGGVKVWVRGFDQSYDRKNAYADAYAKKLRELTGEDRIYSGGRLD